MKMEIPADDQVSAIPHPAALPKSILEHEMLNARAPLLHKTLDTTSVVFTLSHLI